MRLKLLTYRLLLKTKKLPIYTSFLLINFYLRYFLLRYFYFRITSFKDSFF